MRHSGCSQRTAAAVLGFVALAAAPASAQTPFGLNIDIDFNFPGEPGTGAPASAHAAAGGQAGTWNSVSFGSGPFALTGLTGAASGATLSRNLIPPASTIDLGHTGDYAKLVYDADRIDSTLVYTINGLPAGQYVIYTYAAAPSFGTVATRITINGSAQIIAGAPTDGSYSEGYSHARHEITHAGGAITITAAKASINGVVNGFQIVPVVQPPPGAFSIVAPANGATGVATAPTLAWNASSNAASYSVVVDTESSFAAPTTFETTTTSTSVPIPSSTLAEGTQYFWRVTATNPSGSTAATPNPASFTTATTPPPPPPTPFGLNIDVDFFGIGEPSSGVPASTYAAASGQSGTWNSIGFGSGPFNLVGLTGQSTTAQLARAAVPPGFTFDLGQTGNYAKLVYDADRIDGPWAYTITGLPAGNYSVYTYAAAPTFTTIATRITINGVQQLVADAPTDNSFSLGRSHAIHAFYHPGGNLVIAVDKASINGAINGFQIVPNLAPEATITSPAPCLFQMGTITVIGTANAAGLTGWTLEYTGGDSSTWTEIAASNVGVVNNVLAVWETRGLMPCAYTLRLRVNAGASSAETMRSLVVAVPGDVNLNGVVDFEDLTAVLTGFNQVGP